MTGENDALADVSRGTLDRLETYAALLKKWNPAINLVAKSTLDDLWDRHIVDSAQIFGLIPDFQHWADLGSGGGFPGMVVAILAAERQPQAKVTLVESDLRKATFLRTVARETGIDADVISQRIEQVPPLGADVVSARALAPLDRLLAFAERHLTPQGTALFLKGQNFQTELDTALASWRFDVQKLSSQTESTAVILKIGGLARV
ncbi:16S rRNA (guanine(527)-N(7))-methyltransferase RsmG [Actibacterium ureilyticum]|uniref:16S rRNA (guanine(527)-N(7))-methyltransferase RsmG n=1 Tax=Actibacterium ureilyticum TaxID=1590614 RepID=UPI000BAB17F6|nr:16S rRNA (guanine(527)-N(7))-methyltransferase RsmG [Actibacterium ureilyticum]